MDDIFSDIKEDGEKETDSNIEWKKSGIDKHERLTLKINVKEANMYNASKPNDLKAKRKAKNPLEVPKGFKKVRKKIRDAYDDEDEDENDYIIVPVFENMEESSLMRALSDDEKKFLKQNEQLNNIRMQDNAGKEAAIEQAERVIMQAGLGRLNRKVSDQERIKTGQISADEIIADALKQKSNKKEFTKAKEARPNEGKAKAVAKVKDFAQSKEADKKTKQTIAEIENKLKSKEEKQQKAVTAVDNAPQKAKQAEQAKEEVTSIKAEEKAAVERTEKEITSVKEEAKPEKTTAEDKVNQDEVNKVEPKKEEIEANKANKPDEPQKAEAERQLQQIDRDEKIIEEKAKEIVRAEKEHPQEDKKEKQEPQKEGKENSKEIKELIKEKSGRTHKESEQIRQEPNPTRLSEKEYQKALESKVKMYQDRER